MSRLSVLRKAMPCASLASAPFASAAPPAGPGGRPARGQRGRFAMSLALGVAMTAWMGAVAAQQAPYPNRAITLIAPYSVGGDADMAARNFAPVAQRVLGQSVVVMNKTGASGIIGSAFVIAAPADGYTLLLARPGSQSILPAIAPKITKYKWDDFTFIGLLELNPYGCMVNAKSPYRTFDELAKGLRERGNKMNYGSAGTLTTNDLGPKQLIKLLNLGSQAPTQVAYKGTGEATTALLAGEIDFACGSIGTFVPQIKAGTVRALMVTTPERVASLPDVPTAREIGLPDMEKIAGWSGVYGPPNLPAEVVHRLSQAIEAAGKDAAWRRATESAGSIPYTRAPADTRDYAKGQYDTYRSLGESLDLIDKVM